MALRTPLSVTPHLYMGDSTGRPLDKGVVYFGEQDKDPEFYPIDLFSDDELTKPLMQPVHTKGGYLYDKGDMVEPHAKELIYSVKVLDSYGRKVFYKGAMMRNSWNDDVIEQINAAIIESTLLATNIANNAIVDLTAYAERTVQNAIRDVAIDTNLITDALTTVVPVTGTTTARTQFDKNRENITALDFFTPEELTAYELNKTTFDASRPLQEFFTYIANNDIGCAYCTGKFYISTGLIVGRGSPSGQTLLVIGRLELFALNAIDTMIIFNTGNDFTWEDSVRVRGTGSNKYDTRTCRIGIQLGGRNGEYSPRNNFTSLQADFFSQVGIAAIQTTTLSNLGEVRVSDCGSGNAMAGYSLTANWSDKVDSGSQGSGSQNTTIKVDTLPPEVMDTGLLMQTGGKVYNVRSVDREAGTISVFPWLDNTLAETGVLHYMFGCGLHITGGDSSCLRALKADLKRCGIGTWLSALYAPVLDNVVAQACGAGMVLGLNVSSAMVGGQVNGYYCENNQFDLVINTRADLDMLIATTYAFNLGKIAYSAASRLANNTQTPQHANLRGVSIGIGSRIRNSISAPRNFHLSDVGLSMPSATAPPSYYGDKLDINVGTLSTTFNNAFGGHTGEVVVFGTGNNSAPTGVMTFIAPSGYTINGGDTAVFSGFTAAAYFILHCEVDAKAYYVSCTTLKSSVVSSTVSYPTQTLEANTQVTTEVQLEGAVVGNIIGVALNKPLLGSQLWGDVKSTGVVTVYHANNTSNSITTASGNITVKVIT